MLVHRAYRFRLYPNKEQEQLIIKTIGCSRFVFNHFLAKWTDAYKETGKGLKSHIHAYSRTGFGKPTDFHQMPRPLKGPQNLSQVVPKHGKEAFGCTTRPFQAAKGSHETTMPLV